METLETKNQVKENEQRECPDITALGDFPDIIIGVKQ